MDGKNKKFLIIGIVAIVVLLGTGAFLILRPTVDKTKTKKLSQENNEDKTKKNPTESDTPVPKGTDPAPIIGEPFIGAAKVSGEPATRELVKPAESPMIIEVVKVAGKVSQEEFLNVTEKRIEVDIKPAVVIPDLLAGTSVQDPIKPATITTTRGNGRDAVTVMKADEKENLPPMEPPVVRAVSEIQKKCEMKAESWHCKEDSRESTDESEAEAKSEDEDTEEESPATTGNPKEINENVEDIFPEFHRHRCDGLIDYKRWAGSLYQFAKSAGHSIYIFAGHGFF